MTFEYDGKTYVALETAEQADEFVSDETIQDCLEGWFGEYRGVPEEAFIDKLSDSYGPSRPPLVGFEIQRYDNPAAKHLLSRARKIKRELT